MVEVNKEMDKVHGPKIYGVSLMCIIESILFLILYARLIYDINYEISCYEPTHPYQSVLQSTLSISAFMVAIYVLRMLIALVLLKKNYQITIVFNIVIVVGIVINAIVGMRAISFRISETVGVATLCIIVIHFGYLVVLHSEIKKMRAHRTTISTVPSEQNAHRGFGQDSYPPYTIPVSKSNLNSYTTQNFPQAPPSYVT